MQVETNEIVWTGEAAPTLDSVNLAWIAFEVGRGQQGPGLWRASSYAGKVSAQVSMDQL
jgi:hypothetical protein